ncbi:MAG: alginate export family protein [Moraxellaceae bacterium]|jgi:hypothetical protein|nr:alginate export family protein [Moraxellaceae bacterium]
MHSHKLSLFAFSILLASTSSFAAESAMQLVDNSKIGIDARYRFELVDQDNALRNAKAQTVRARISLQTGKWYGVSGLIEGDHVASLDNDRYNDTRNGETTYSLVPDPEGSEINQALLRLDHQRGSIVAGRQRINLDNQRFIGGVGWRQNEQTYDGAFGQLKPLDTLTLTYAYIDNVNTIFGPDGSGMLKTTPANIIGHSQLFNVRYAPSTAVAATLYHYQLGMDNLGFANTIPAPVGTLSSQTSGLRLAGALKGVSYVGEYAEQQAHDSNPLNLDSRYYLAELGYTAKGVALKGGYEVLGGSSGTPNNLAFQTPLATKHAFQGWADQFLTTPAAGVKDGYIGAAAPVLGGSLQVWYHEFRADKGGASPYGEEIDASYGHAIPGIKGLSALVKFARYDANRFSVDTDKVWVQLQYSH